MLVCCFQYSALYHSKSLMFYPRLFGGHHRFSDLIIHLLVLGFGLLTRVFSHTQFAPLITQTENFVCEQGFELFATWSQYLFSFREQDFIDLKGESDHIAVCHVQSSKLAFSLRFKKFSDFWFLNFLRSK